MGLLQLRTYDEMQDDEEKYHGGEAKQIKALLVQLDGANPESDAKSIAQVRLEPMMKLGRETTYEFIFTRIYPTLEGMHQRIVAMEKKGWIAEHAYPILEPSKRAKWVVVEKFAQEGAEQSEDGYKEIPGHQSVPI